GAALCYPATVNRSLALLLALALLASSASAQQAAAQAAGVAQPPPGPILLTLTGKGAQVYQCQAAGAAPQWVLSYPDAQLLDPQGRLVGSHRAGPSWRYKDGSVVYGEVLRKTPAPSPGNVAWLLLGASSHQGTGILTAVQTIERTDTHGGLPPTAGCDAAHSGSVTRVAYSATYVFRAAPPQP
ncbi:MAG TPA: DUF3455 domain-containing protein, partial [Acidobacteriaceae bacterium]